MRAKWMEQFRYFGYNLRQQISGTGPVAQLAEQATLNRLVGRSIRPGVTACINTEAQIYRPGDSLIQSPGRYIALN